MAKAPLSVAAQEAQDYLDERVRSRAAEQVLEVLVEERIKCKGKTRSAVRKAESIDSFACGWHKELGGNLDEYKKRCRIRKMHCTPEQYAENILALKRDGHLDGSRSC